MCSITWVLLMNDHSSNDLYIAYDIDDFPIGIGTIAELQQLTGMTKGSIYSAISRTRSGKQKACGIYKLSDLDCEDYVNCEL